MVLRLLNPFPLKVSGSDAAFWVLARQFSVQALGMITGIVLAREFSIEEFGLYAALLFQFSLHLGIGDLGLGASVVRQSQTPDNQTLRSVFTTRVILDCVQVCCMWHLAPIVANQYALGAEGAWAFRLVAIAAAVQSLQLIPTVLLERALHFRPLALAETFQSIVFTALCITIALLGLNPIWIGAAWIAHSLTGALLLALLQPWSFGFAFNATEVRERLRFSLPYQGHHFGFLLRDSAIPVFAGFTLGANAVGTLSWSLTFALSFAIGALALQRVFLPQFAQLQDAPEQLSIALRLAISLSAALIAPLASLALVLATPITLLVFGEQWLPALPILYILWPANVLIPFLPPLLAFYNARGESRITFMFVFLLGTSCIACSLTGGALFGLKGFAAGLFLSHSLTIFLIRKAERATSSRLVLPGCIPWLVTSVPAAVLFLANQTFPLDSFPALFVYSGSYLLLYLGMITFYFFIVERSTLAVPSNVPAIEDKEGNPLTRVV